MPDTSHLLYDVRLLRRNLRDGKLSEKDLQAKLEALEDLSDKFEIVEITDDEPEEEDAPAEEEPQA